MQKKKVKKKPFSEPRRVSEANVAQPQPPAFIFGFEEMLSELEAIVTDAQDRLDDEAALI